MEIKFLLFLCTFILNIFNVLSEETQKDETYTEMMNKQFVKIINSDNKYKKSLSPLVFKINFDIF